MKFLSIKEYFYKLNTIGFILLLLPLVVFIFLYYLSVKNEAMMPDQQSVIILLVITSSIFFIDLTIVHWVWKLKIARLRNLIELAKKMDGFFPLAVLKMAAYCFGSLLMAAGFFLSESHLFTAAFIAITMTIGFQWPSPSFFCNSLDLRGNERAMIMEAQDMEKKK